MTPDELETLLDGGRETRNFEVKGPCNWYKSSPIIKDILAMSNLTDGGKILIGVKDGTFERVGVSASEKATFAEESMQDQVSPYADPHVEFTVSYPKDRQGLEYVLIEVKSFSEIPVICRKKGTDLVAGVVYCRSVGRRPESAPVPNSYIMRDILFVASARMAQRYRDLGMIISEVDNSFEDELRDELGDL
jgi:predicted HTH transcriptional regulator